MENQRTVLFMQVIILFFPSQKKKKKKNLNYLEENKV